MQLPSTLLENAVAEFAKLPGIGKKTALRLVLHLLKQEQDVTNNFSEVLKKCARKFNSVKNVSILVMELFALFAQTLLDKKILFV